MTQVKCDAARKWCNTNSICNVIFYLWNDNHLTPSQRTTPDVIRSSAKYWVSIPSSSCFLNWIPDVVSSSIESWAYMSSLAGEKERQHSKVPYFKLCFSHWHLQLQCQKYQERMGPSPFVPTYICIHLCSCYSDQGKEHSLHFWAGSVLSFPVRTTSSPQVTTILILPILSL